MQLHHVQEACTNELLDHVVTAASPLCLCPVSLHLFRFHPRYASFVIRHLISLCFSLAAYCTMPIRRRPFSISHCEFHASLPCAVHLAELRSRRQGQGGKRIFNIIDAP